MLPGDIISVVESVISEKIIRTKPVSGGCITSNFRLETETGKKLFLKTQGIQGMFICESNSLLEIKKSHTIRVPEVIYAEPDFLLLEFIESSSGKEYFFESFGRKLAHMHRYTYTDFGFFEDNFIGNTPQINQRLSEYTSWTDFYFTNRLLYQYKLAEKKELITSSVKTKFNQLEKKICRILDEVKEPPSLLHGDLWRGNFLCDEKNNPVLIDPAVYYGHREADLAMTKLFGGFSPAFYAAYQNEYPLTEGWEYRENIYKLYHIFNHLNMFGRGYLSEAEYLITYYI